MSSRDHLRAPAPTYERFSRSDRVQHAVMVVSFLVLTVTGLPQKFIYLNNRYLDDLIDAHGRARGGARRPPLGGDRPHAGDGATTCWPPPTASSCGASR